MAFIRICLVTTTMLLCILRPYAQSILYPAGSSQLLRSTATDVSKLFGRSNPGFNFNTTEFNKLPAEGIIFIYDSTVIGNGTCKVFCNGKDQLVFRAAQDNGLVFGVYQYMQFIGFKFFLPGSIWEQVPVLNSHNPAK